MDLGKNLDEAFLQNVFQGVFIGDVTGTYTGQVVGVFHVESVHGAFVTLLEQAHNVLFSISPKKNHFIMCL